jgi:N-methylhydantoinase B/oxoprolinase/acetone carboxylase alpha subunit
MPPLSPSPQSPWNMSSTVVRSTGDISDPNGIMNDQFMSVLKESLSRQGEEALTEGPEAEEFRKSATVEMLEGALSQSVHSLRVMNAWKQQIDAQVVAQEKQVQRLNFALTKAKNDEAYMQSMKKMLFETSD